jgi:hypothetical protein
VSLVSIGGNRVIRGGNNICNGAVSEDSIDEVMKRVSDNIYIYIYIYICIYMYIYVCIDIYIYIYIYYKVSGKGFKQQ